MAVWLRHLKGVFHQGSIPGRDTPLKIEFLHIRLEHNGQESTKLPVPKGPERTTWSTLASSNRLAPDHE
jgi:hypothetical protein